MTQPNGSWHFERRINLGDVLTSLAMVGTLALFMFNLDKRVTVVEERQAQQAAVDRQQDERMREMITDVRGALRDSNEKLDKLVERQLDQKAR